MAETRRTAQDRSKDGATGGTRRGTSPPKGRPTPGRRQRNAAARARARRDRWVVRAWWALGVIVVAAIVAALL